MATKTKTKKASPADYRPRVAGIEFGATSATVTGDVSKDKLLATIGAVQRTSVSAEWWLGDLLAYGEGKGGLTYEEILPHTTYQHPGSLRNVAWVSRHVPPDVREPSLHWRTHKLVASLKTKAEKRKYLREAARDGLTSDQLQAVLNKAASEANEEGSADKAAAAAEAVSCVCQTCGQTLPDDLPARLASGEGK